MRELYLDSCGRLKSFISIVHNMGSIKRLSLHNTGIKELPSWIGCFTSLELLNLSRTSIKQLPSSIGNLTSLVELYASGTLIEELPSSIEHLTSLKKLWLGGTSLNDLPSWIGCLISLELLDVSGTLIEELPASVTNIASLRRLYLSNTRIKELPSSIGCLTSLENLDVSSTFIEELPPSIWDLTSLRELEVSSTPIRELPSSIGNLTSLSHLNVSKTHIKELPSSIGCLTSLKGLDASETLIEELPLSIGDLTSLRELNVNSTPIRDLPSSIGNLTSLSKLNVSKTLIKELPSSIGCLTSLEELDASETLIEELPLSIGDLICLKRLKLEGCGNLTNVPHSVYGGLKNLQELDLSWCLKLVTFPSRPRALVSSAVKPLPLTLSTNSNHGRDDCGPLLFPLRRLCLSGSSFDSLPACISNFSKLEYLDLGGCKNLRDISELPAKLRSINLDDCVSLEGFSKLSNMLEQKVTLGRLLWMNLSNCRRLVDKLGMNIVSKMAKAFLHQLLADGLSGYWNSRLVWDIILPSLEGIEVPDWFDSGNVDTTVLCGDELVIKIPRTLKGTGKRIGLVVCAVIEITHYFPGGRCCTPELFINRAHSMFSNRNIFSGYYLDLRKSSADDNVWVWLAVPCIDFKVVVHQVRIIFSKMSGDQPWFSLKSYGVHLVNMQQSEQTNYDHVSGQDLALDIYRPSNAGSSDSENEEGASIASAVSNDSNSGEQQQEQQDQSHDLPTTRLEDLGRQTNIEDLGRQTNIGSRAMLAFLRCFGITCL